jgi:hypothetical protein
LKKLVFGSFFVSGFDSPEKTLGWWQASLRWRDGLPGSIRKGAKKVSDLPFHGRPLGHFMSLVSMCKVAIFFNLRLTKDLPVKVF